MISILGNRIYLHERDNVSFRVIYTDSGDRSMNFRATDNLILTVYNRESHEKLLQKEAENVNFLGSTAKVFTFGYEDSVVLSHGDYEYSIMLVTREGGRYTLIDEANLHILEDNSRYDHPGSTGDDVEILTPTIHLCNTPLVCKFNYIEVSSIDGSLIIF